MNDSSIDFSCALVILFLALIGVIIGVIGFDTQVIIGLGAVVLQMADVYSTILRKLGVIE